MNSLKNIWNQFIQFTRFNQSIYVKIVNDRYESANALIVVVFSLLAIYVPFILNVSTANLGDTDGKVLVKADVLEWEVIGGGQISGAQKEMLRIQAEIASYFAFCSCMGGMLPGSTNYGYGTTSLIRS